MKKYKFTYEELDISTDRFIRDFVKALVSKYKITQKSLDKIYTELVNEYNK